MTTPRALVRVTIPLLLLASDRVLATAGGGGGGGGGGDDPIGIVIELIFWIIWSLPFPLNLITLAVIVAFLWFGKGKVQARSGLNRIPSVATVMADAIDPAFLHRNPAFAVEAFRAKVGTAFREIQQAWMRQDMAPVRRYISDGVWQRFNTQFAMMRLLEQRNEVKDLVVRRIFIDRIEQDGAFDIIHAGIHFSATDDFVSAKYPQLDQKGPLEALEYWSFIRRTGVAEHDLYHGNRCPACGAELPADLGEVARCGSCQALSTLGDYDWVLAEITQADDYGNRQVRLDKAGSLTQKIRSALGQDADFSVQMIEDKASNAYLQILAAQSTRRPEAMRRFVGDALFAKLSQAIAEDTPSIYSRLYLNAVTLIDTFRAEGQDHLVVALRRTAQRVCVKDDGLHLIDQGPYSSDEVLVLARDAGAGTSKGQLYAHSCPACGAPLGDTLDIRCSYCDSILNSTRHEWIVTRLMPAARYRSQVTDEEPATATRVAPESLDPLFAAREYAINNVLTILGSDGAITIDELSFAHELAATLRFDTRRLEGLFDLARNRRLSLRLPDDRKTADKVMKLMEKAALADHRISDAERSLLDEVRARVEAIAR